MINIEISKKVISQIFKKIDMRYLLSTVLIFPNIFKFIFKK